MGYYCTVPQCTSLAGKTKNVKFHRFPRDVTMADKWNIILKRGKPYTKYSKVCSLHFTHADYNVTTMGQWKTLSKDAVPSQNLPKLNPDGTVMVIRKSRTVKYKENRRDEEDRQSRHHGVKVEKWSLMDQSDANQSSENQELAYRLQTLSALASSISPAAGAGPQGAGPQGAGPGAGPGEAPPAPPAARALKQDATMQTDPVQSEEDDTQPNNSYSEASEKSFNSELQEYPVTYQKDQEYKRNFEMPKDYTKSTEDYIPQTNEEYNKEAEKYALERKSHNGYDKEFNKFVNCNGLPTHDKYQKVTEYQQKEFKGADEYQNPKLPESVASYPGFPFDKDYPREYYQQNGSFDSADVLRNQQHNLQILQEQHRVAENQNFFNEGHIKQEDLSNEDEKFLYERPKDPLDTSPYARGRLQQDRLHALQHSLKQEPEPAGHESIQAQQSPYYSANGHDNLTGGYYSALPRPGPELLIAKQNALAAHTQLWQNSMKRPFFYSESPHYNAPQLLHRYEDLQRILQ